MYIFPLSDYTFIREILHKRDGAVVIPSSTIYFLKGVRDVSSGQPIILYEISFP